MSDICGDNRFELIEKYKQMLIENTNIEMEKDEMAVIDNILFRLWQMGWLDKLEQIPSAQPEVLACGEGELIAQPEIVRCKDCKHRIEHKHYGDLGESAYTCEGNMVGWILPDDFCSHAERRTDEQDSE